MIKKIKELFGKWKEEHKVLMKLHYSSTIFGERIEHGHVVIEKNTNSGRKRAFIERASGEKDYNISLSYAEKVIN